MVLLCGELAITVTITPHPHATTHTQDEDAATADGFFDMICKYQSQRLDEQRAFLPSRTGQTPRRIVSAPITKKTPEDDKLLEMLWSVQHSRLNEQRCEMPSAPHLVSRISRQGSQQHNDEESEAASSSSSEEEEEEVAEEVAVEEAEEKRDHLHDLLVHAQVWKQIRSSNTHTLLYTYTQHTCVHIHIKGCVLSCSFNFCCFCCFRVNSKRKQS